jgi:hypothetical protein
MASKKAAKALKKYCRIFLWVRAQDSALAEAIQDLCLEGALSGSRRHGATFLYPAAKVRKQIVKDAYSEEPEEAIRLLEAHIIPTAVRSAADFREGVGSRLGVLLEVEEEGGETVTLKGGAKLKPAGDFVPLRKDNIAVWTVEEGEVPLEGPEFKFARRRRSAAHEKGGPKGAYEGGGAETARSALASRTEEAYAAALRGGGRGGASDPYLTCAVSLLNFLKLNAPAVLAGVLPLIDRDPAVTFYLLLEPYKTKGDDFLLPSKLLFGARGWNGAEIYETAVAEFEAFFEPPPAAAKAGLARDRSTGKAVEPFYRRAPGMVREATDRVRLRIIGEDGRRANKISTPKEVREVYATLAAKNAIGGLHPVFPDRTIAALPGAKKLWQDELRFVLHAALQEVRGMPVYDDGAFAEIVGMLRHLRPGNDYAKEAALASPDQLRLNVAPQAEFMLLVKFVNSTCFLYAAVPAGKVGGGWGDVPMAAQPGAFTDPRDLRVWNPEQQKQQHLAALRSAGVDAPHSLDAGCIARIRHYVALHGRLPPDLGIVQAAPPSAAAPSPATPPVPTRQAPAR